MSTRDWTQLTKVLSETQGMCWMQLLPAGQKSSQPLQFNAIHVLPQNKIPFEKVPLDKMIANKINLMKKAKKGTDGKNVKLE